MSSSPDINYAKLLGFESVAAAVIFAVFYMPFLGWFVRRSIARPTYVFGTLVLFCAIRVTAFIIRAVLAGSDSAGHNLGLLIGDEILFGVGFAGLLYSAYTLVLDRMLLSDSSKPTGMIASLTANRRIFRLAMTAAVALGIAGASNAQSSDPHTANVGKTLRIVGTIIFLVLTVLQAYQTLRVVRAECEDTSCRHHSPPLNKVVFVAGAYRQGGESWGVRHGSYILCAISLLLLIREAFATATSSNAAKQNNEHLWYPLSALPEILAVALYATPGLVPPRSELPT
ncbi:hypothetical protein BD779DRAFT_1524935 [Infundibulicybe gibba]|nr:hypothetical protein BD779DRAFT_1524935 [Infundibulicybe gibba]